MVLFAELGKRELVVIRVAKVLLGENLSLVLHAAMGLAVVDDVASLDASPLVLLLDDVLLDAFVNSGVILVLGNRCACFFPLD